MPFEGLRSKVTDVTDTAKEVREKDGHTGHVQAILAPSCQRMALMMPSGEVPKLRVSFAIAQGPGSWFL